MPTGNLKLKYQQEIAPQLVKEFNLKNLLAAPKIEKIVINLGIGEASHNQAILEEPKQVLAQITGQKPKIAKAKASVAGFKVRAGDPIGLVVTLRGQRMYDFLEKLVKIALPRIRDFQGVSRRSFDHKGNYSLGISEYSVFPEVDPGKISRTWGIEVTLVIKTKDIPMSKRLLELLGMPFEKQNIEHRT